MNLETQRFCQSCGMPMGESDEMYGIEADGTTNSDYCKYCYGNGAFLYDVTMEEMMAICIPHMVEQNPGMTVDAARQMMQSYFPHLKRWNPQKDR